MQERQLLLFHVLQVIYEIIQARRHTFKFIILSRINYVYYWYVIENNSLRS